MEDYKKLVERLREEPKDSRKAVLSIYDICVDAAYAIESLLDKLKYAEGERDVVTKRMIELEEQNAAFRKQADELTKAGLTATDRANEDIKELHETKSELDAMRNELCCKCGNYKQAHNGACGGFRWKQEA